MTKPYANLQAILKEFASRFRGVLRDWFLSLRRYRQIQFIKVEVGMVFGVI